MAQQCISNNMKKKVTKLEKLAKDVAVEIVVGGDRFDKEDIHDYIKKNNMDLDLVKKETEKEVRSMEYAQDDSISAFNNEELDYWFEPIKK